jgi:hypothetical protein
MQLWQCVAEEEYPTIPMSMAALGRGRHPYWLVLWQTRPLSTLSDHPEAAEKKLLLAFKDAWLPLRLSLEQKLRARPRATVEAVEFRGEAKQSIERPLLAESGRSATTWTSANVRFRPKADINAHARRIGQT